MELAHIGGRIRSLNRTADNRGFGMATSMRPKLELLYRQSLWPRTANNRAFAALAKMYAVERRGEYASRSMTLCPWG